MNDSQVTIKPGVATVYAGADAVKLFQAVTLKHGLLMYADCKIMPNRNWTPARMLAKATEITGHKYKRGAYREAAKDVTDWIATMKAAMPVKVE